MGFERALARGQGGILTPGAASGAIEAPLSRSCRGISPMVVRVMGVGSLRREYLKNSNSAGGADGPGKAAVSAADGAVEMGVATIDEQP